MFFLLILKLLKTQSDHNFKENLIVFGRLVYDVFIQLEGNDIDATKNTQVRTSTLHYKEFEEFLDLFYKTKKGSLLSRIDIEWDFTKEKEKIKNYVISKYKPLKITLDPKERSYFEKRIEQKKEILTKFITKLFENPGYLNTSEITNVELFILGEKILIKFMQAFFKYIEIRINNIKEFIGFQEKKYEELNKRTRNLTWGNGFIHGYWEIKNNIIDEDEKKYYIMAASFNRVDDFEIGVPTRDEIREFHFYYAEKYTELFDKINKLEEKKEWFEKLSEVNFFSDDLTKLGLQEVIEKGRSFIRVFFGEFQKEEKTKKEKFKIIKGTKSKTN